MPQSPEEQLAYLGFQRVVPAPVLRPYIRSYWYFCSKKSLTSYQEEYMHPTGGFGIVFNFADPVLLDRHTIKETVFLDGANTISRKMGFQGHIELLGIRFYEGGAFPFFAMPLTELRNEIAILEALARPALLDLHERMYDASSLSARITILEQWLMKRLFNGQKRHPLIPASLVKLRTGCKLSIPDLAQELAISQRQLDRLYRSQVGMSPQKYVQLQRVETARLALKELYHRSTTELAHELGFYDQSHFIREFKAVIGMTPYQYLKRSQSDT